MEAAVAPAAKCRPGTIRIRCTSRKKTICRQTTHPSPIELERDSSLKVIGLHGKGPRGFAIMLRLLPGFARPRPVVNRQPAFGSAEPRLVPTLVLAAPLFQSRSGLGRLGKTTIQICSHSTSDRSIDAPTVGELVAAARKNFGTSKSNRRVAGNSVARIEGRWPCPVQERHR